MFKTTDELKEFITWAKSQGVKSAKIHDIQFELSEIAYVSELSNINREEKDSSKTMVDTLETNKDEEEDLLFYSSGN